MTTRTTDNVGAPRGRDREENLPGTETKAAFKTTELIVYVLAVLGVLIASMIVDQSFGADPAWRYVTYLTIGYMISRGLAKSGSRNPRAEGEQRVGPSGGFRERRGRDPKTPAPPHVRLSEKNWGTPFECG